MREKETKKTAEIERNEGKRKGAGGDEVGEFAAWLSCCCGGGGVGRVVCVCVCCGGGQDGCLTSYYQEEEPDEQEERMATVPVPETKTSHTERCRTGTQLEIVHLRNSVLGGDGSGGNIR